jgi:uncharacterized protein (TIGR02145 family)
MGMKLKFIISIVFYIGLVCKLHAQILPAAFGLATPSRPVSSPVVNSGLVMHLDAGNSSSYPGSGTAWTDLSTSGNNATLTNGPTYSSSNGGAIVFDGVNDAVLLNNATTFGSPADISINIWVRYTDFIATASGRAVFRASSLSENVGFAVYQATDSPYNRVKSYVNLGTGLTVLNSTTQLSTNQWYFVTLTYNSSVLSLYINGVLDASIAGSGGISWPSPARSPQFGEMFGSYFKGSIAQMTLYNKALTAAEVLENFNALRPRFNDVTNPTTGKIWMDRNLGAMQVATSSTDANSYGDLYQWGRGADGHQIRASATTSTLSSTDVPGNANFILVPNPPYDWRSTANSNLWQGVNGVNNPCPAGYRLPTQAEWNAERLSWSSQNAAGAFASPLKLPMAGRRDITNGATTQVGTQGWYWTSTTEYQGACNCNISKRLYFFNSGTDNTDDAGRTNGFAVRCIKD